MTTGTPLPPAPAPTRTRSRARRYAPLGVAVWLVLEVWLLTLVARASGGLTVLLLLIAGGLLGATVVKRAGRRAFRNLNEALGRRSPGEPGTMDGKERGGSGNGFLMLGGLLLMLPGLLSDAAGLLLLLPPVRAALGRRADRALDRRMRAAAVPGSWGDALRQARIHRPDGKVVPGEVIRDGSGAPHPGPADETGRPPLTP
ncbi:FxsA family protein [Streptomyces sp. LP05-1]|uniref:FxsA family protein n=1 Tax=Streptomyces pyxinae TaxID=2970734 RepID=A0ABT2CQ29_9ACTN|nr:FxsA family membrane protein [Streptomyces sp. LP05-1]MCS0639545.1 FxsA family protein [Streptomyces sp. LP05-1]